MEVFIITDELKKAYTDSLPTQVLDESDLFFGAQEGADPAGVAAIRAMGNEFLLTYIFVRKEFRRQGVGTMLMDTVKDTLQQIGADRLEIIYTLNEMTAELHDFLEEQELTEDRDEDEKPVMRMYFKDIPEQYRTRKTTETIVTLKDVSGRQWSKYTADYERIKEKVPEYAIELKPRDYYDPDYSVVRLNDRKEIEAAMLFSKYGNDLVLEYMNRLTWPEKADFMSLFFGAVQKAKGADPDMSISYCIYNPRFRKVSDLISDQRAEQIGVSMTQYIEF
ncbi:MAG: GNAT family N-acetyltransferase [Lachnospiraceae bacterium]|nr:GNAT family N-acetyltransferase [Lachnospiraceae bacterium]